MATTESLYYYAVTYTASTGAVAVAAGATGTKISVTTSEAVLNHTTTDVDDTTVGVENTYIGTVTVDGVKGYLVQDTQSKAYYVFLVSNPKITTKVSTTVNKSTSTSNTDPNNWNATVGAPACFMAGTAVRTPSGEVAVEALRIGDEVTLSDGRVMPVSWIGIGTVATRFADPLHVLPIRIKQDALGDGMPARDLLLSPDHALLLDGILVQAGALINGTTIVREEDVPAVFSYYHVEVADHSLILAENVPAETFVDNISRMVFDNWEEHRALFGDEQQMVEMQYPRAKSARQLPATLRARLDIDAATPADRAAA